LLYLSCGPESLATDLEVLRSYGFSIEDLRAYDFMPGTPEVETLAVLRRRS
jgi:23S rRNA (uracil1939-C5)-methyltransferase